MKLCIISHTEHYKTQDGHIVGWGPTVSEINHLMAIFDEIYHIAMLHKGEAPPSALPYTSSKIKFVELPALGGRTLSAKLSIVWNAPKVISVVNKTLRIVDCFQVRTPTGIGVFLIPYLTLFIKKKGWYKYAGNWNQKKPPFGYRLQRWMLKHQKRKVTINGVWENQPNHCITFENPCLTADDLESGAQVVSRKTLINKISFCFVGRLEKEKGVELIINTFMNLSNNDISKIDKVHLIGNGEHFSFFKDLAKNCDVNIVFHGFLSRTDVFEIYKQCHVFLLPSMASEGFPKVIAEAMNFGCIPIVSNISSIGQYIKDEKNGFLLEKVTLDKIVKQVRHVLNLLDSDYKKLVVDRNGIVLKFTFAYYNNRVQTELLR